MVLYAFGMMFFDTLSTVKEKIKNPRLVFLLTGITSLIIVIIFVSPIISSNIEAQYPVNPAWGNTQDIGVVLFTKYLVPFEIAAVMLLVAMIGGIILAGKKMEVSYSQMSEEEIDIFEKEEFEKEKNEKRKFLKSKN